MPSPATPSAAASDAKPDAVAVQRLLRRTLAPSAPAMPWLHQEIARRMAQRLALVRQQPQTVLDWWSVRGGGLPALQAAYPKARIEAVEPTLQAQRHSAQALQGAWWQAARWTRQAASLVHAEEVAPADGRAQLLWSNMMLHWSSDPERTLAQWHKALAVEGFVMFSCLGPDTLRELRAVYGQEGWGASGQSFVDMHDIGDTLVHAGFADPVMDMERLTLTWPDAQALLDELRSLGINAAMQRHQGLRTPRWRNRLAEALTRELRGADGRLALSFEVIYGHAFKAAPRVKVAAEARVSADALQAMARSAPQRRRGA